VAGRLPDRRCYRGDIAAVLTGVFAEPKPLMGGTWEAGDPVAVMPVLYHLLWTRVLVTGMTAGLLGPGSVVGVRQEGAGR